MTIYSWSLLGDAPPPRAARPMNDGAGLQPTATFPPTDGVAPPPQAIHPMYSGRAPPVRERQPEPEAMVAVPGSEGEPRNVEVATLMAFGCGLTKCRETSQFPSPPGPLSS